ncbi:MAG: chlorophyll synthesis pathway protein BchC [Betaproteobacteria bacterium]|nr:chlorophyll synthesis pathway protein BchC [Betaproteobacteria bacterium]
MTHAQAIVFDAPQNLSVQTLAVKAFEPQDIEVAVHYSGISTGTERLLWEGTMPAFPGLGYPLVPGYETVGQVVKVQEGASVQVGDHVFVPGSYSFEGVRNIFGGAGSRMIVPHDRVVKVHPDLGPQAVLLALAATGYHAIALGGQRSPLVFPDLIVGHGVMGRLLARICLAMGQAAPTVWETQALRQPGAKGYHVVHPSDDDRKDYRAIYDVSGDASILNSLIMRLAPGGEVVLAGFYKQDIGFAFAPAFMREAQIRVAAQWKKHDLQAVAALVERGTLSLDDLITHTYELGHAHEAYQVAFGEPQCLKMMIHWQT